MLPSRRQFLLKIGRAIALVPILSQCTYDSLPPILKIISPSGGEVFVPQQSSVIRWKAIGVGLLLIELSIDGGKNWLKLAADVPPEPEFLEWQVPKVNSTECLIRLSDMQNPELQGESEAVFSIQPILKLTYPNGGEFLKPNEKINIRWEAGGVGALLIELSSTGGTVWTKVAENVPAETGLYEWTLPRRNSMECLIRLSEMSDPSLKDESDAFFSIRESFTIQLAEHPELSAVGGFKLFESPLGSIAVLVIAENVFKVLSLTCTHAGCTLEWKETGFQCPCHGSAFSREGCVLGGPAQQALWIYEYKYEEAQKKLTVFNSLKPGIC